MKNRRRDIYGNLAYTVTEIHSMFPNMPLLECFMNVDKPRKMYYLGRFEESRYWAGRYKNDAWKIIKVSLYECLEFSITL